MRIRILYFSGTGSTRAVAETLAEKLTERSHAVELHRIWRGQLPPAERPDRLVLAYPVHAANAPRPVLQMIRSLPISGACPTTLVCVSGGGEGLFNNGSREWALRLLQQRQYPVIAEYHVVMPTNFGGDTPFALACELLAALPKKADAIADGVPCDRPERLPSSLAGRLIARAGRLEQKGAPRFGRAIEVRDTCTGCGLCEKQCPEGNIAMADGRPIFAERCVFCMACLQGCPERALKPGVAGFSMTKEPYDLRRWQEAAAIRPRLTADEIRRLTRGPWWRDVGKYLLDLSPE